MCAELKKMNCRCPIILIVTIPDDEKDDRNNWLLDLNYSCFTFDLTNRPIQIPLEIVSIITESTYDFKSMSNFNLV